MQLYIFIFLQIKLRLWCIFFISLKSNKFSFYFNLGLCYSNLNPTSVTISWKNVPPVQPTDGITYILHRNEKESTNSQQVK